MNFYSVAGQMALGSRLRRLADMFTSDAEQIYRLYGVEINPRWFPVFYMLTLKESASVSELADDICQTHAAVSQVVRDMVKDGIVEAYKCAEDGRVSKVSLTTKGHDIAARLVPQCEDVNTAISEIFNAANSNLWSELDALEKELARTSLFQRVGNVRKAREKAHIELVPYAPKYKKAFKALNEAWIRKHWEMEPADYKALDNPTGNIINKGGCIVMALYNGQAVGTCALINMGNDCYELAKMAVDDSMHGRGIGFLLGKNVIEQAKSLGAKRIYLESNTILIPAVKLYQKLGFTRTTGHKSPYERCNIQMEFILEKQH